MTMGPEIDLSDQCYQDLHLGELRSSNVSSIIPKNQSSISIYTQQLIISINILMCI